MCKELLSRIEFDSMDLATHVSTRALEPNEPAHNTLPFPCTRICLHATSASDDWSAPNAMAYSMECSMAHAGHSSSSDNSRSSDSTRAAAATAQERQQQQRQRSDGSSSGTDSDSAATAADQCDLRPCQCSHAISVPASGQCACSYVVCNVSVDAKRETVPVYVITRDLTSTALSLALTLV